MKKQKSSAEKPYNRCLACHHRTARKCDGPRTSAMGLERWCEFMRDMKEANGLTNAEIAERSGVSLKTIERLMAQNCSQDIMRETARMIEDAIIGSSNQYPCYLAFEESSPAASAQLDNAVRELERALNDNKDYRSLLDKIHETHQAEMQTVRSEAQAKTDYLRQQVAYLQQENLNLWTENNRKSRLVDMFIEKQNSISEQK